MKRTTNFLFTVMLTFSLVYFNGCTVIGIGIGAIADASTPDTLIFSSKQLSSIEPGEKVTFKLQNNEEISGIYLGYKKILDESYKNRYYEFLNTLPDKTFIPKLGEQIIIRAENRRFLACKFLGVNKGKIFCLSNGSNYKSLNLREIRKISNIDKEEYSLNDFKRIIESSNFPMFKENNISKMPLAVIISDNKKRYYSEEGIKQILMFPEKNGILTGAILGGSVDIAVLIIIANSAPMPSHFLSGPL